MHVNNIHKLGGEIELMDKELKV